MKDSVYIFSHGKLSRKDHSLLLITKDGKKHIPVEGIKEIFVFNELDINKRVLEFLAQKEILLLFYNHYGYYIGAYYPREHYNSGFMIINQAKFYADQSKRLFLAQQFVKGACHNFLKILTYYQRRSKDIGSYIEQIREIAQEIENHDSLEKLMALEAQIKKKYFKCYNFIIAHEDFRFTARSKRPPKDYLNALISFGNSLVYSYVLTEIYKTHLDPRIGYLHTANFRRFSLNLDVAEIFKPIISDRSIFHIINKNMISAKDFIKESNGIFLNDQGRKKFIEVVQKRLNQTIKHSSLNKKVSYRRLMRMELYKLEKHFMEDQVYSPFVMDW